MILEEPPRCSDVADFLCRIAVKFFFVLQKCNKGCCFFHYLIIKLLKMILFFFLFKYLIKKITSHLQIKNNIFKTLIKPWCFFFFFEFHRSFFFCTLFQMMGDFWVPVKNFFFSVLCILYSLFLNNSSINKLMMAYHQIYRYIYKNMHVEWKDK